MRFPAFLSEHPLEAVIGVVLLLALVFGSADRHAAEITRDPFYGAAQPQHAVSQNL